MDDLKATMKTKDTAIANEIEGMEDKIQKLEDTIQKFKKNWKIQWKKLDVQVSIASNKTRQMELDIKKEDKNNNSKRNEISHCVNKTICSKNHDELLKQRAKGQKSKERANCFRE